MFDVGSQVLRESNGWVGTVLGKRQLTNECRIEVRWASGVTHWIPIDQVKALDKVVRPKEVLFIPKTKHIQRALGRAKAANRLASNLNSLAISRKHGRKQRNNNKAKKLSIEFNQTYRSASSFTPKEREYLISRIERDRL